MAVSVHRVEKHLERLVLAPDRDMGDPLVPGSVSINDLLQIVDSLNEKQSVALIGKTGLISIVTAADAPAPKNDASTTNFDSWD